MFGLYYIVFFPTASIRSQNQTMLHVVMGYSLRDAAREINVLISPNVNRTLVEIGSMVKGTGIIILPTESYLPQVIKMFA